MSHFRTSVIFTCITIILLPSCDNSKDKKIPEIIDMPITKTVLIKSDPEAKALIEPYIITFRKSHPNFKVNIEYIDRTRKIENADIIVFCSPAPSALQLQDYDTMTKKIDTLIFIKNNNNNFINAILFDKSNNDPTVILPEKIKRLYTTQESSPDITTLFNKKYADKALTISEKKSNDYQTIINWVEADSLSVAWTSKKQFELGEKKTTPIPIIHMGTKNHMFITREIIFLTKKSIIEKDITLIKFESTLKK